MDFKKTLPSRRGFLCFGLLRFLVLQLKMLSIEPFKEVR